MSWQSKFACWLLRWQFRPETTREVLDPARARRFTDENVCAAPCAVGLPAAPVPWRATRAARMARTHRLGGGPRYLPHAAVLPWRRLLLLFDEDPPSARVRPDEARGRALVLARLPAGARAPLPGRTRRCAGRVPATAGARHAAWSIVLGGDSAGGGLALATLVALRDRGERLPAGAILFSPWTDLAATGATLRKRRRRSDVRRRGAAEGREAVCLGDEPGTNPYASPLYADFAGLPPLYPGRQHRGAARRFAPRRREAKGPGSRGDRGVARHAARVAAVRADGAGSA